MAAGLHPPHTIGLGPWLPFGPRILDESLHLKPGLMVDICTKRHPVSVRPMFLCRFGNGVSSGLGYGTSKPRVNLKILALLRDMLMQWQALTLVTLPFWCLDD
ncbi:unnamed protein product [Cuscuta campestris]|uniref:Uncharacterized protein n=1 Tax=Cuscuta campestris TaxID=132261 RepID=A0A484LTZ7_9ASTE|nr:unnamed protein product [Cuscuta campestris]